MKRMYLPYSQTTSGNEKAGAVRMILLSCPDKSQSHCSDWTDIPTASYPHQQSPLNGDRKFLDEENWNKSISSLGYNSKHKEKVDKLQLLDCFTDRGQGKDEDLSKA